MLLIYLSLIEVELFIEEYLAEQNSKIGSANRSVEKEWKMIEQMWEN